MALLERESALAALAEYALEARAGDGRLVLVAGEAGAGKSALVEEFQHRLRGARWAWGACDGLSTPRPLGPLVDAAADLGGEVAELVSAGADRERLFGALLRRLEQAGELTVVVVEDVHWADEATLDLLRFLGRRVRAVPALLLVTYRDTEPADPLRLALGELVRHRSTRRIDVGPLSPQAVADLAAERGIEPGELYRLTGGNPFYVTEVLRAGTSQVPPSARDAVLARVARLSPPARSALEAAALLGARLDVPVLAAVADCPPAALDELTRCGLLAEDGAGLRFRHEIARLAVAQLVPAHRRGGLHGRILAALRAAGSRDDARLAFHAEGAGAGADARRYATAAARQAAALGSHREAAAQYDRALRFAADAPQAEVAELLTGLAEHTALADRWETAAAALERALGIWRGLGDRAREGGTLRRLADAYCSLCRGAEAGEAALAAVAILEPLGPSVELARAYGMLASLRMIRGENADAVRYGRLAASLGDRLGALDVRADALDTEACATMDADPGWTGLLEQALALALEHGLRPQAGRAYANLYGCLVDQRRFAEAAPYFTAGMAYCEEHDLSAHERFLLATHTSLLLHRGSWDEALAIEARIRKQGDTSPVNRICPSIRTGTIQARRGDGDPWVALDGAMDAAARSGEPQFVVPARLVRAEAWWLAGDLAAAREEVSLAAVAAGAAGAWLRGETAVWLRRTGSPVTVSGPYAQPYELELAGEARRAAELWLALDCRFDAAMALLDADEEAPLREALALLDGMGAVATARVVRRRLRRLGVRSVPAGPRAATRAQPFGLTQRERQVLELLSTGSSNAQIAEQLVISIRTVDHHVSAVLAKLGAPTRAAATAEAARHGLLSAT